MILRPNQSPPATADTPFPFALGLTAAAKYGFRLALKADPKLKPNPPNFITLADYY